MHALIAPRVIPVLYHFTDTRNVASIRTLGAVYPLAMLRQNKVDIPAPGGNQWSHELDQARGLDRYVHLCFRDNHPMEHVARQDGRIQESIFLQIDPAVLSWPDVLWSPEVSNKSGAQLYPWAEGQTMIDMEVLYSWTDWRDPAIRQRLQRAEKSELLVPHPIPVSFIRNLSDG